MFRPVLFCMLAASALAVSAQDQQVFRVGLNTVPVYATVTDKTGRLATDLTRDDFQIFDNGQAQPITIFDNSPQPIRLIIMIDVSGSVAGNLRLIQVACEQLLKNLRPDDQVKVGTFGNEIAISPSFTSDVAKLRAALPTDISPEAPTPLWRALAQALSSFEGAAGRPAILLMTDGRDGGPVAFGKRYISVLEVISAAFARVADELHRQYLIKTRAEAT
ncbi:MAG TPA: VWA domain-containing protein [Vicinamibacterales bacterium]|nr:VWA domain-containing protein [Vicinamibacterales bacterium]